MIFAFSLPFLVYSQEYNFSSINELGASNYIKVFNFLPSPGECTGSPYENEEFVKGTVVTRTNKIYKDVPLRLNLFNNTIQFKDEKEKIFELENMEMFEFFTIGDIKIKYLPYAEGKRIEKAFFKILEEGEAILLIKQSVKFEEATKLGAYQDAKPASYKRMDDEIFIKVGESEAKPVSDKKVLNEILSAKQPVMADYFAKNKIKITNREDVQKVVKYYNSL